jgi:putative transposase
MDLQHPPKYAWPSWASLLHAHTSEEHRQFRRPRLEYPDRFEVRYVSANGGIRWNRRWVNVSTVCVGEYVGLEEIGDGIWTVYFGPIKLGQLFERHMRIEDQYGRLHRRTV